jgi:hypothetical protein
VVLNVADDQPGSHVEGGNLLSIHCTFLFYQSENQAVEKLTHHNEFKDLHKFQLSNSDWNLLKDYEEILQVIIHLFSCSVCH